ncbi:MAG TPA: response regulator [Candidatus Eisenbacteria bacterium]|nr:response regulator [Candidatus Eisenbacteria bacterium]
MHRADKAVLVVDRSQSWCQYVADALVAAGYHVDWTVDPHTSVDLLDPGRHALAIVDADLGALRAADLVAAFRRRDPSLRVVLTSGTAAAEHADDAQTIGAFFSPKLFRPQALLSLVAACLSCAG